MSRRAVLSVLAAAIASPNTARAGKSGRKIIVIGAGLAGLSAARDLVASGAEVMVLEARQRIGGRIWTSRTWPDLPMDMGASWIHGVDGNPLTALADQCGAKRVATSYDNSMALDPRGNALDLSDGYDAAQKVISAARGAVEERSQDISLKDAIAASKHWMDADEATQRMIRHVVNGSVEAEYGGAWSEVSAWHYDDDDEFGGSDELFPGGFDQIVTHVAEGLDIRTGHAVSVIAPQGDGISVILAGGSTLTADHAIATVPLGVLKGGGITFGAPLTPERQDAIATLGMGLVNKCWLRFERVAWPDDVDWIEWIGPRDGIWSHWVSLAHAAGAPVLLAFHAGDKAREMERFSDAEMTASAHAALQAMFGADFPAPTGAQITRWSEDPFTRGSYSFNAVGTSRKTREALAGVEWGGRLVFAGEACSAGYFGTAQGAVLSGRAAAEIVGLK